MDAEEQYLAFCNELDALTRRFSEEFDMPAALVVAALEIKKHLIIKKVAEKNEEEQDQD